MSNWKNLERKAAKTLNGRLKLSDFQDLFGKVQGL